MIIEYNEKYNESVKDLLCELQMHIKNIDIEGYNKLEANYRELYFKKTLEEVKKYQGKILLYLNNKKIIGLVVGLINNDEIDTYEFKAPKRGRISELVVLKNNRNSNVGTKLLEAMESYLKSVGCKDVLIEVFAYNNSAIKFYLKKGYHNRLIEMSKSLL